ncbi:MAG: hypothetical protein ACI8UO_003643 [Verrucomicrobiales bacterium]|jgi:hypothetical protein
MKLFIKTLSLAILGLIASFSFSACTTYENGYDDDRRGESYGDEGRGYHEAERDADEERRDDHRRGY